MKKFLERIKFFWMKAPLQIGVFVVNLLVPILLFVVSIVEQHFCLRVLLLSLIPFLISFVFLLFKMLFDKRKVISFLINFIVVLLIVCSFFFHILNFCFFTLLYVTEEYPTNDLGKYSRLRVADYFPREIPQDARDVKMYYNTGVLQAGTYMILYYKTNDENLTYYRDKYVDWKELFDEENRTSIRYYNTPYENGITDEFVKYQIYVDCDESGTCNHGVDKHYAINYESKEIIFYYANW